MKLVGVIGILLILDSLLAIFLDKRYLRWGLEYLPASYRNLITRLSGLPAGRLLAVKLAEGAVGIALLFWVR